jgi:hypothetical protein
LQPDRRGDTVDGLAGADRRCTPRDDLLDLGLHLGTVPAAGLSVEVQRCAVFFERGGEIPGSVGQIAGRGLHRQLATEHTMQRLVDRVGERREPIELGHQRLESIVQRLGRVFVRLQRCRLGIERVLRVQLFLRQVVG